MRSEEDRWIEGHEELERRFAAKGLKLPRKYGRYYKFLCCHPEYIDKWEVYCDFLRKFAEFNAPRREIYWASLEKASKSLAKLEADTIKTRDGLATATEQLAELSIPRTPFYINILRLLRKKVNLI